LEHGVYLLPQFATFLEPPECDNEYEIVVWNDDSWKIVQLEEVYSLKDKKREWFQILLNIYNFKLSNIKWHEFSFNYNNVLKSIVENMFLKVDEIFLESNNRGLIKINSYTFNSIVEEVMQYKRKLDEWRFSLEKNINSYKTIKELNDFYLRLEEHQNSDEI
jgi:hypothetical protein